MSASPAATYRFARFTLDLVRGCLREGEREIKLRPKSFYVLSYLVQNAGRLLSKDELMQAAWPGVFVSDNSLTQRIKEIRHALDDGAHVCIKTVAGRGYRFDAPVTRMDREAPNRIEIADTQAPRRRFHAIGRTAKIIPLGAIALICAGLVGSILTPASPPPLGKGTVPPGNVIVEMRWDQAIDADVDLWVQGPGDLPVGYSNKSGIIFNLLHDDFGRPGVLNSMNYETAHSRGRWPGEYVVNAMLYRSRDRIFPVPVHVRVSLQGEGGEVQQMLHSNTELTFEGQETTVSRFKLDDNGALVAGSLNRTHKDLHSVRDATE